MLTLSPAPIHAAARSVARRLLSLSAIALLLVGSAQAAWPPPTPAEPVLSVSNTTDFARTAEIVRGGVPMPRARALTSTAPLALIDDAGNPVPASFRILARWHAPLSDTSAPIQWLLVRFHASLAANATRSYRIRMDGSVANPAPVVPLQVAQQGAAISINTGVARFVIGSNAAQVFDRIEGPGGVLLSSNGGFSTSIGGAAASGFSSVRRVVVEHADALSAAVIVEGVYGHPAVGGGSISGGRRFEFAAGSPAVSVREWVDWEGERCAFESLECGAQLNALPLERWRIALTPAFAAPRTIGLQASLAQPMATASASAGATAALRQRRRSDRLAAQRFELELPSQAPVSGTRVESGVALLSGASGGLGLALRQMADFEPQALRLLADGSLAADLADDGVWLAARQGAYAEYRVGAFAAGITPQQAGANLWPALNAPLIALPARQWIAASQATDEFPAGALPAEFARFDILLQGLLDRTVELRRARGLEGLMTFGLFPRTWGDPVRIDEIDCGAGADPTPADDWDDPYWCGFWTDYHNASANAVVAAWRFADPAPLHALSHPAAMRQLHTQMIRCAPNSDFFFCGQLPSGYRAYRSDRNSSHQYVENLILTYWMTGDRTIVERLRQGLRSYRGYLCPARGSEPPGPVCAPQDPVLDTFAGFNDRVASQFYQIFRFVGLASDDASFLEDWRSNTARFLTQNLALVNASGGELGFTEPSGGGSLDFITGPGTYDSTQLWMASIYDFNVLHRWQVDTDDAALGIPPIAPSRARQAWSRTLLRSSLIPPGNGTAQGVWPNSVRYTFSGPRIGGTLTAIQPGWAPAPAPNCGNDDCLYDEGKATLTATLARAADDLDDPVMDAVLRQLVVTSLDSIEARDLPMGKSTGEYFGRLTSAVARLSTVGADPNRLFSDGFED